MKKILALLSPKGWQEGSRRLSKSSSETTGTAGILPARRRLSPEGSQESSRWLSESSSATTGNIATNMHPERVPDVAQVSNLLYRRLPVGRPQTAKKTFEFDDAPT